MVRGESENNNKVADLSSAISIVTLNANSLNTHVKGIVSTDLKIWPNYISKTKLTSMQWHGYVQGKRIKKNKHYFFLKAEVIIVILDSVDFGAKEIIGNREFHYRLIQGSIHQEGATILSACTSNNRASKYMK